MNKNKYLIKVADIVMKDAKTGEAIRIDKNVIMDEPILEEFLPEGSLYINDGKVYIKNCAIK